MPQIFSKELINSYKKNECIYLLRTTRPTGLGSSTLASLHLQTSGSPRKTGSTSLYNEVVSWAGLGHLAARNTSSPASVSPNDRMFLLCRPVTSWLHFLEFPITMLLVFSKKIHLFQENSQIHLKYFSYLESVLSTWGTILSFQGTQNYRLLQIRKFEFRKSQQLSRLK